MNSDTRYNGYQETRENLANIKEFGETPESVTPTGGFVAF